MARPTSADPFHPFSLSMPRSTEARLERLAERLKSRSSGKVLGRDLLLRAITEAEAGLALAPLDLPPPAPRPAPAPKVFRPGSKQDHARFTTAPASPLPPSPASSLPPLQEGALVPAPVAPGERFVLPSAEETAQLFAPPQKPIDLESYFRKGT